MSRSRAELVRALIVLQDAATDYARQVALLRHAIDIEDPRLEAARREAYSAEHRLERIMISLRSEIRGSFEPRRRSETMPRRGVS